MSLKYFLVVGSGSLLHLVCVRAIVSVCVCVFAAGGFKRHVILTAHGWTWQKKLQAIIFHLLAQTKV